MISIWWLIPAFLAGCMVGMVGLAVLSMASIMSEEEREIESKGRWKHG